MKKVLLIEDEVFIQDIVSKRLIDAGYELKVVDHGDDAADAIKQFKADLILLDIDLPGTNGFTILEELRVDNQTTPVIIFSNNDAPDNKAKATELGAQDFYFKAATGADELLEKVPSS